MKSPHSIKTSTPFTKAIVFAISILLATALAGTAQVPIPTKTPAVSSTAKTSIDKCVSGNCVNGKGKKVYANDDEYEGDFVNGKRAGRGVFTSLDIYTGQFANDKYNGKGTLVGMFTGTYEGNFVDGKKSGEGTERSIFDDVYTGSFANDEYNGKGKIVYADGSVGIGDFVGGMLEGQATVTYKNGDYYTGAWKKYLRNGYGKEFIKATNTVREGIWKDGVFVGATNSKPVPLVAVNSNTAPSNPDVGDTLTLMRDTLNGKFEFLENKPLAYMVTKKGSGETLFYNIEFISDGGKLAFRWKESTKNEQSEKLVITDKAIASASKYVNFFSTKTAIAPDKEIAFILSQTLYQQLKSEDEIKLDLGKGPQRISFNYDLTAIFGIYTTKNVKLLDLQGDLSGTTMRVLDDPMCPLIVEIETPDYKLELTKSPPKIPKISKTETDWQKLSEPFVSKMETAVNTQKNEASAKQIYADFEAATKEAGASVSVRNIRKTLLKTMHRSNIYPLTKFVREKLKTLNYNEEETKDILSPRQFYV